MRSLILTLLGVVAAINTFAQLEFKTPVNLPYTGEQVRSEFGDVDGDGDNDLVFTTSRNSALFVLYNDPIGKFTKLEKVVQPVGSYAQNVAMDNWMPFKLHDMDADGVKDIVLAQIRNGGHTKLINILRFNGSKFESVRKIELAEQNAYATKVHCHDLNGDGKPDIIIPLGDKPYALNLESTASSSFAEKKILTPGFVPGKTEMTDVNGDGNIDLIVTNSTKEIPIYTSDNKGNFTLYKKLTANDMVFDFVVAKFTNDSRPDIIALAGLQKDTFDYFKQESDGNFSRSQITVQGLPIFNLTSADFDGDGDPDFGYPRLTVDKNNFGISAGFVTMENKSGSFVESATKTYDNSGSLTYGDIDNDKKLEIVPNSTQGHIEIYKKDGDEYKSYSNFHFSANGHYISNGVLKDLDKDGKPDLAWSLFSAKAVAVAYNIGGPTSFGDPVYFNTERPVAKVLSGDFNADSYPDIVYSTFRERFETGMTGVILSDNEGKLTKHIPNIPVLNYGSPQLTVGDYNNDGIDDFAVDFLIVYGTENEEFDLPGYPELIPSSINTTASADFNNDGFDDIVFGTPVGVSVVLGKEAKGLDTGPGTQTQGVWKMWVAKLNSDNFPDLAYRSEDNKVVLLKGKGDGTFTEMATSLPNQNVDFPVGDFDGNGTDDIGITVYEDINHWWMDLYTNDGNGNLTKSYRITMPQNVGGNTFAVGLINEDDRPDIVAIGLITSIFYAGKNTGPPTIPVEPEPEEIVTAVDDENIIVRIWPNPVKDDLFVNLDSPVVPVMPLIYDATGRSFTPGIVVHPNGLKIDVRSLTPGIYYLKTGSGAGYKFVKE